MSEDYFESKNFYWCPVGKSILTDHEDCSICNDCKTTLVAKNKEELEKALKERYERVE